MFGLSITPRERRTLDGTHHQPKAERREEEAHTFFKLFHALSSLFIDLKCR